MADAKRVTPREARRKVQAGEAVLVCGYESEEMCANNRLEGALTLGEFTAKLPEVGKEREIIFYCK